MRRLTNLFGLTVILSAIPAAALDWPQWLGPNRDGISAETDILLQ